MFKFITKRVAGLGFILPTLSFSLVCCEDSREKPDFSEIREMLENELNSIQNGFANTGYGN